MMGKTYLGWVNFYTELGDKLLQYKNDRLTLIQKIKVVFNSIGMPLPKLEKDYNVIDIDPFTVFGLFNKRITDDKRHLILKGIASEFSVNANVPDNFDCIPLLHPLSSTFYGFLGDRNEGDIDNLWNVYVTAIEYANTHSEGSRDSFIKAYDTVLHQKGVKWNLTMGLFWIRPYEYLNLDTNNRLFIRNPKYMPVDYINSIDSLKDVPKCSEYLNIIEKTTAILNSGEYEFKNYPELSYYAWKATETTGTAEVTEIHDREKEDEDTKDVSAIGDDNTNMIRYWIYSPGEQACMWDEFYENGIMGIGWSCIGDLRSYSTKESMKQKMKECIDPTKSYRNDAHTTWQFVKDMKVGDIVFVKKGRFQIVGRGIVASEYKYDDGCATDYKNIRKVNWTHKGEWDHPGKATVKTLTDITLYTSYVEQLNALFEDDSIDDGLRNEKTTAYTEVDFLNEVYMSKSDYEMLSQLLKNKKNVILQGAPGVGKTFAAKRLAYSMMKEKAHNRVMMVQFHQSYSYEDFIMGYRPRGNGFALEYGPFYKFCKEAEQDFENDYYFIIDEINRGNLSKIFGELFMLIENDKRKASVRLLYQDEQFSVPKNVYIIGMMNTADRSLAMMDYALRRRFAFFDMPPAFATESFCQYKQSKNNEKFNKLIDVVEKLNVAIENDEVLGAGFRIGHSYFCVEKDKEIDDLWLNSVIKYEIVPLLKEYWFDEPGKVREWETKLSEAIK